MLKQTLAAAAHRLGYTITPNWQMNDLAMVRDIGRRFELLGVDLVIDVGANAGQFRDMLRERVGYQGQIVSFEPVPALGRALATRADEDPGWTVVQKAVGSTIGQAEFHVMAETEFSSFLTPSHDDVALFTAENRVTETVTVAVTTLDVALPPILDRFGSRGVYLKLDTQGYDLEALKGGAGVLGQVAGLQTEASVRRIYQGAPTYQEVFRFVEDHGFVMSGIYPNNAGHFPFLVEFDCHFVNGSLDVIKRLRNDLPD